ncbi:DNA primase [Gordoniibacillus kamchatkensis]|uniref:DNA primase n=1 Tax=Gordoniibacillus kamchatkensis TaxID=1590651 RepID=A0ABR5AL10_9BACL|nr:DNA primase [Paenibacillus sp. VKM B-2647]KIL41713.1 DNA primase [Paenibacillus sp. VKM B-2647]
MGSGRIPDDVIEAVLKAHDIADVVGKYVHLSKQGHYLKGLCPFHSEKTPSFTVTPQRQIFHCFGCGAGGNSIQFVMQKEGLTFSEAVRQLAEEAGIPIGQEDASSEPSPQQQERSELLKAYELSARVYRSILMNTVQGRDALAYLRSRGMSDELIETFQLGYAPNMWDALAKQLEKSGFLLPSMERGGLLSAKADGQGFVDKFRDRVMIPIHDPKGRVIAFGGRAMGDVQPKYLNSPETALFHKSHSLFNLHRARTDIRKREQIVLFEGYFDVIRAWDAGVHHGVATMGTALTAEHAEAIKRLTGEAVICYDGDSAGQAAAFKSIPLLEQAGLIVKVAMLPDGKDPDEYIAAFGPERFVREVIEGAVTSTKFRLLYARRNFRLQEEADRLRYLSGAVKLIAGLPSPLEREHYLRELASEFDVSLDALKADVAELLLRREKSKPAGDNNANLWNNVRNNGKEAERVPPLKPASYNAERLLLAVMMYDRDVCKIVEERLGDGFMMEAHAVLAAYLYSFYAQEQEPSLSKYLATLQDPELSRLASSIAMIGSSHAVNERVIDDYISQIKKAPLQQEIKRKEEEAIHAERMGDPLRAAQIRIEMITLEKQLRA